MTVTIGTRPGRHEIRSKLGEGGMGEVYLAADSRLHRNVALIHDGILCGRSPALGSVKNYRLARLGPYETMP